MATTPPAIRIAEVARSQIPQRRSDLEHLLRKTLCQSISGVACNIEREIASTIETAVRHPRTGTLIALDGNDVVGALFVEFESARSAFVRWLVVDPEHQRRGIGNRLLDDLELHHSVGAISGFVNLDDPAAVGFWEQRGWSRLHPPPRRVRMGRGLAPDR